MCVCRCSRQRLTETEDESTPELRSERSEETVRSKVDGTFLLVFNSGAIEASDGLDQENPEKYALERISGLMSIFYSA